MWLGLFLFHMAATGFSYATALHAMDHEDWVAIYFDLTITWVLFGLACWSFSNYLREPR